VSANHPNPLIVIAAPNGARLDKRGHAAVPLTAAELAADAEALAEAGVSVLHLHVRDDAGQHSLSVGLYREAIAAIRARVGRQLVIQVTSESAGQFDRRQQMAMVRELRPEAVSLALRELCPDRESETEAGAFFQELKQGGSWPQFILYSPAEVARFDELRRSGFFGQSRPFALFVLGRHGADGNGDPADLHRFLEVFEPGTFPWAVCCFGPREAEAVRLAASLGGHVRIGFENNRLLPDGTEACDNAQLVRTELAGLEHIARPPATADWVRKMLPGA